MPFLDPVTPVDEPPLPRAPEGVELPAFTPPSPSLGSTVASAFRQDNPVVNVFRRAFDERFPIEPDHNPLGFIRGTDYEANHLDKFVGSQSMGETRAIMRRIDEEEADRKILAASGGAGFVAQIAAGTLDPTLALPGGVVVRGIKGGYSVSRTALATGLAAAGQAAIQEGVLQATQETRAAQESALSIASSTIIGGLIGAGAAKLLTRQERLVLAGMLNQDRVRMDAHAAGLPEPVGFDAFHGSPYDFDRFDLSKIGSGEGAQSFGHGLYLAEQRGTARYYMDLAELRGSPVEQLMAQATKGGRTREEAISVLEKNIELLKDAPPPKDFDPVYTIGDYREALARVQRGETHGTLYQVRILADRDRFLDWDKPLSQQSEAVQKVLRPIADRYKASSKMLAELNIDELSGENLLRAVRETAAGGSKEDASRILREAGIPGIRYLDQGSRPQVADIELATRHVETAKRRLEMAQKDGNPEFIKRMQDELAHWENNKALLEGSERQTSNFVVFDDGLLMITHKNDVPLHPSFEASVAPSSGGGLAGSVGAAATDTRQLELDRVGRTAASLSPTRRTLAAEAVEARRVMADLAEVPYHFRENEAGVPTTQGPALDRLARMEMNGTRVAVSDQLGQLFSDYRFGTPDKLAPGLRARIEDLTGTGEGGKLGYHDFKREVSIAMMNGDRHAIPQVERAAQFIRQRVFEPWAARAEKSIEGFERLAPADQESYFAHIWNKQLIKARRPEFTNRLVDLYKADQETKRGIQQRLEFYNAQLQSWDAQIAKLEARFGRAEERAKTLDARAAERSRDDMPKITGFNEPDPTGRVAELQQRRARIQAEAKDLSEAIDLLEELQRGQTAIPDILRRTIQQLQARTTAERIVGAQHQEAGRAAKRSEKRLAALEAQLEKTESRKDLIEDYIVVAQQVRDEVRAKIEAEIGAWDGKSAQEAKAALASREKYQKEAAAAGTRTDESPRLASADDAVDRVVARILKSDREVPEAEIRARAQQTVDRIIGSPDGRLPYDMHLGGPRIGVQEGPPPRGSLAERQLAVSNAWAKDWIEQDIEQVVAMHLRTMVPDVLLAERFGDVEMTESFRKISEAYANLSDATKSEKERLRLANERDAVIRDVAAVRDRVRGVYGWSPELANMARIANGAKVINNITSMGMAAVSSIPDLAGTVFRYGLGSAFRDGWTPFFRGLASQGREEWAQFRTQMRAIGIGVETAINARQHTLDDVVDVYRPQSRFERTLQATSDKFFVANLLAPLTDAEKLIASHVAVSEILRASKAAAEGKATRKQLGNLAESGIDQSMAGRIAQQFDGGGEVINGVHLPNTAGWTDRAAADALNGAVSREVDIMVVTPGQEKPLWMSKPVVSLLGQFKAFTASATERILIANLQRRDAAALQGIVFSLGLGMLSYKINSFFGGQKASDRPQDWVKEGISRGGLLGWLEDGNALATKATRGSVDIYRLIGADKPLSRFASRSAADMLLGPTWGKIEALPKISGSIAGAVSGKSEWSAADTRAVRRLLPFQNLLYLRGLLNKVEESTNSAFGVPAQKEPARH